MSRSLVISKAVTTEGTPRTYSTHPLIGESLRRRVVRLTPSAGLEGRVIRRAKPKDKDQEEPDITGDGSPCPGSKKKSKGKGKGLGTGRGRGPIGIPKPD